MHFLELKPLQAEQLPAVVELDQSCLGGLWNLEGYQRELESPNSLLLTLCTQKSQAVDCPSQLIAIGCFWSILEEAHITILGVHPDFQGRGLGQLLLYSLLRQAAIEWQLERATLEVRESNSVALSIYQKFGFKVAGQRRKYYKNPEEDALILWLSGLSRPAFIEQLAQWDSKVRDRLFPENWQLNDPENVISSSLNFEALDPQNDPGKERAKPL
ncbi:MAG: ribosomal protein S18-alanine N-acetyltransferase [Cyanobacteriota bacterium]